MRKTTAYAILEPNGKDIKINSIRSWKKHCIDDFSEDSNFAWEYLRKIGWSCIKVTICYHSKGGSDISLADSTVNYKISKKNHN